MKPFCAFLSHASEDKDIVRKLAADLEIAGIKVFYDEWDIRCGDSIRQRIDSGLNECTHFIAIISKSSLSKAWVNAEIDAAFILKLSGKCVFMPVRINVMPDSLPPLLKAINSQSIDNYELDVKRLILAINGTTARAQQMSRPHHIDWGSDKVDNLGGYIISCIRICNESYGNIELDILLDNLKAIGLTGRQSLHILVKMRAYGILSFCEPLALNPMVKLSANYGDRLQQMYCPITSPRLRTVINYMSNIHKMLIKKHGFLIDKNVSVRAKQILNENSGKYEYVNRFINRFIYPSTTVAFGGEL